MITTLEAIEEADETTEDTLADADAVLQALIDLALTEDDEFYAEAEAAIDALTTEIERVGALIGDPESLTLTINSATAATLVLEGSEVEITKDNIKLTIGGVVYTYAADLSVVTDTISRKHFTVVPVSGRIGEYTVTLKSGSANNSLWKVEILETELTAEETFKSAYQASVDAVAAFIDGSTLTLHDEVTADNVKSAVTTLKGNSTELDKANVTVNSAVKNVGNFWTIVLKYASEEIYAEAEVEVLRATGLAALDGKTLTLEAGTAAPATLPTNTALFDSTANKLYYNITAADAAPAAPISLQATSDAEVINLFNALLEGEGNKFAVASGKISAIEIKNGAIDLSAVNFATIGMTVTTPGNIKVHGGIEEVILPKAATDFTLSFNVLSGNGTIIKEGSGNIPTVITLGGATGNMRTVKINPAAAAMSTVGQEGSEVFTITTTLNGDSYSITYSPEGDLDFVAFVGSQTFTKLSDALAAAVSGDTVLLGKDTTLAANAMVKDGVTLDLGTKWVKESASGKILLEGSGKILADAKVVPTATATTAPATWYGTLDAAIAAAYAAAADAETINVLRTTNTATGTNDDKTVHASDKLILDPNVDLTVGHATNNADGSLTVAGKMELKAGASVKIAGELIVPALTDSDTDVFVLTPTSKLVFPNNGTLTIGGVTTLKATTTNTSAITMEGWIFGEDVGYTANITSSNAIGSDTLMITGYFGIADVDTFNVDSNVDIKVGAASGTNGTLVVAGTLNTKGALIVGANSYSIARLGNSNGTINLIGSKAKFVMNQTNVYVGSDGYLTLSDDATMAMTRLDGGHFTMTLEEGEMTVAKSFAIQDNVLDLAIVINAGAEFVVAENQTLTYTSGVTLVNNGTMTVRGNVDLANGSLPTGDGIFEIYGLAEWKVAAASIINGTSPMATLESTSKLTMQKQSGSGGIDMVLESGAMYLPTSNGGGVFYQDTLTIKNGATLFAQAANCIGGALTVEAGGSLKLTSTATGYNHGGSGRNGTIILQEGAKVTQASPKFNHSSTSVTTSTEMIVASASTTGTATNLVAGTYVWNGSNAFVK